MEDDKLNPDQGVRLVVRGLDSLEKKATLYEYLYRVERFRTPNLAWGYVLGWVVVLGAALLLSFAWAEAAPIVVVAVVLVAGYRWLDVVRWYADFLLDRAHDHVLSPERNLLFVFLNLIEAMLVGAIWLRASGSATSAGDAAYQSFALVTQLGLPVVTGAWAKVGIVLTEVMALTLLLGGVAVLISEVQDKVRSTGSWREHIGD